MGDVSVLVVRKCTVAEIENTPNFPALVDEYASEAHVDGMPPVDVKKEQYRSLEGLGVFQFFGAYLEDVLIGFITVLCTVMPHFGVVLAVSESYFVAKDHRKTGAGTALRLAAEKHAEEMGAPIILICTQTGSTLCRVMESLHDYRDTNHVFLKRLRNV
jgi:GNAT superfamily N-acetyltransferase